MAVSDTLADPIAEFLIAATSGDRARADALLAAHPTLADANIYAAAVLGDDTVVRGMLSRDPARATVSGGPRGWDPLTYVCFSHYLTTDVAPDEARHGVHASRFVRTAAALLASGAGANTGFMQQGGPSQHPEWACALYGAAAVAGHPGVTRLLLAHGADANDEEVVYHAAERYDHRALTVLVEHGTLSADSLATLLLRKCDWHDADGVAYLLAHGADANRMTRWHRTALYQAIIRDNAIGIIAQLLDAGADATRGADGISSVLQAARDGRRDCLELFAQRGVELAAGGSDAILVACAMGDRAKAVALAAAHPADRDTDGDADRDAVVARGGATLAEFAGIGNAAGVEALLAVGVPVNARHADGDGYWGLARESTALHVAAWRARHETVRVLIAHGADVHARDADGRTPLMLAVKACVDSYWTDTRRPDSVAALLAAGARPDGVAVPCGYDAVDLLLRD